MDGCGKGFHSNPRLAATNTDVVNANNNKNCHEKECEI